MLFQPPPAYHICYTLAETMGQSEHIASHLHALPDRVKLQDVQHFVVELPPVGGEDATLARGARDKGIAIGPSSLKEGKCPHVRKGGSSLVINS